MAVKEVVVVLILFSSFIEIINSNPYDNALNVPQVLLPYVGKGTKPTTFVLKAQKGCFKWSSSKPNIATITPIDEKTNSSFVLAEDDSSQQCSVSALVTVKLKSPEEDSTVILAEEEGTGFILRCDVFVDSISQIEITTTTRELLLGENPEVFDVHGYDLEGNRFTTLGSETFNWNFLPSPNNEHVNPRSVLKFLWFEDSSYETHTEIYELETKKLRGFSCLVEGIKTGEAIVSAKLAHSDYKDVNPSSVKLTVIDNVMLIPPVAYILVEQRIKYDAQQLRRGNIKEIILPSDQYTISLVDKQIASLLSETAFVKGTTLGSTKVQLVDTNMGDISSARRSTANLYVVEPAKIGFAINPGKVWVLQTGRTYAIHVQLFDENNNKILIDDYTIFESMLPAEYFDILTKSNNGSYFYARAKQRGKTLLTASLERIHYPDEKAIKLNKIFGEQPIEIYDPLMLSPEIVLFPWDASTTGVQHKYQLKVSGGSGSYQWTSVNTTFTTVNKKGLITTGNTIGQGTIKVADAKNLMHVAFSTVKVFPPEELNFHVSVVQVLVGQDLVLPLSVAAFMHDDHLTKVHSQDCHNLHIDVTFSDHAVFKLASKNNKVEGDTEACTSIIVEGLKPGHTTVTATYQYADVVLKATVVIAAYNPLEIIDPVQLATVTLGSKKRVIAKGGPLPWILDDRGYYELMSAEEEDWVEIEAIKNSEDSGLHENLHYFDVTCTQIGEQLLSAEVGNKKTVKNVFPATSTATSRFSCSPPVSIQLQPMITLPMINNVRRTLESCRDEQKRIPVRNQRDLRLNLQVFDSKGLLFDDISSLNIEWTTDNPNVGSIKYKDTLYESVPRNMEIKQNSGSLAYQLVGLSDQSVPLVVTATITSYKQPFQDRELSSAVTTHIHLMLIADPQITPNYLHMYAHPTNKVALDITGGTKHFVVKGDNHAIVKYHSPNKINVEPQSEGKLIVALYDTCLDSPAPAKATIVLSDVYSLKLTVADQVELGENVSAICEAFNLNGEIIQVTDINVNMKLRLKKSVDILNIIPLLDDKSKVSRREYTLEGKSVGIASLTCQASSLNGNEISSKAEEIQVFSAIELEPKYVLLIVGAIFQVHSKGGPHPQSTTVYSLENATVANVDQGGLVTARVIGKTVLTGKSKGIDSGTGKEIIYSKDTVIVEVIQLKGFKISLRSRQLVKNAEIGILSVGITDATPFTFAVSPPYLQFDWSTTNHDVAEVNSVHHKTGVSVSSDRDFRAVVQTLNVGFVTIKLKVKVLTNDYSQVSELAQLEDSVQIQVYEKFEIKFPSSGKLLIPHNSNTKIQHNRDQLTLVTYQILPSSCPTFKRSVVEISSSGEVTASTSSGVANVLVTSHEEFGFNQTAVVQIEVKQVASITLLSLSKFVVKGLDRPAFPLGSSALFSASLHDIVGRKFDVTSLPLKHRLSRSDIIDIVQNSENTSFTARATSIGETVLKVYDKENPSIADYVRIKVAHGILPNRLNIQVGQMECLSVDINTDGSGYWSSSSNLLSIDQHSGVIIALASGTSMVYFHENGHSTYAEVIFQVTVSPPSHPPTVIEDEGLLLLSNALHEKHIFLHLSDQQASFTKSSATSIQTPFFCLSKWSSSDAPMKVESLFDIQSKYINGRPACVFTTLSLSAKDKKLIALHDYNLMLSILLIDKSTNVEYMSPTVTALRFIPDVFIETTQLRYTSKDDSETVNIYGSFSQLSSLKVNYETKRFTVTKLETSKSDHHQYKITILNYPAVDEVAKISFHSPLTGADHTIEVDIRGAGQVGTVCLPPIINRSGVQTLLAYLLGESGIWLLAYTIMIATIIAILVLYHLMTKNRQPAAVMVSSPYLMQRSPPPYSPQNGFHSPIHYHNTSTHTPQTNNRTPGGSKQRTLFSVSQ